MSHPESPDQSLASHHFNEQRHDSDNAFSADNISRESHSGAVPGGISPGRAEEEAFTFGREAATDVPAGSEFTHEADTDVSGIDNLNQNPSMAQTSGLATAAAPEQEVSFRHLPTQSDWNAHGPGSMTTGLSHGAAELAPHAGHHDADLTPMLQDDAGRMQQPARQQDQHEVGQYQHQSQLQPQQHQQEVLHDAGQHQQHSQLQQQQPQQSSRQLRQQLSGNPFQEAATLLMHDSSAAMSQQSGHDSGPGLTQQPGSDLSVGVSQQSSGLDRNVDQMQTRPGSHQLLDANLQSTPSLAEMLLDLHDAGEMLNVACKCQDYL